MKKLFALAALVTVLATSAFANLDRTISCGPPVKLSGSGRTIIGGCSIPSAQTGLATDDTILFFDNATGRIPINTGAFSRITSDSVIWYTTCVRRDGDNASLTLRAAYTFPGQTTPAVVGDTLAITCGATVATSRFAAPLLPGRGLTIFGIVSTPTDTLGVLGAYGYDK